MKKSYKNNLVWICGASTGIGNAIANELLKAGARLIISSRSIDGVKHFSNKAYILECDVTEKSDWHRCSDEVKREFGYIDTFIYNAGDCEYIDCENFHFEPFKRIMDINFLGMVRAVEQVLPLLRKSNHPHLIGIGSSADSLPLGRAEAYGASKAALAYFLESLRIDLKADAIDVSIVKPGFVKTPLTDKNDFPMPFIISAEEAGKRIVKSLEKRPFLIDFPKRFTYIIRLMGIMPTWLRYKIAGSFTKS